MAYLSLYRAGNGRVTGARPAAGARQAGGRAPARPRIGYIYIYIYIHMYMYICICICMWQWVINSYIKLIAEIIPPGGEKIRAAGARAPARAGDKYINQYLYMYGVGWGGVWFPNFTSIFGALDIQHDCAKPHPTPPHPTYLYIHIYIHIYIFYAIMYSDLSFCFGVCFSVFWVCSWYVFGVFNVF